MKRNRKRQNKEEIIFLDSFIFKFLSKSVLWIIIIIFSLTFIQCTVKTPQSPQWNTNLTIPVINRIYQLDELLEKIDDEAIKFNLDGDVALDISEQLDTFWLDTELLKTENLSFNAAESLGVVYINAPSTNPVSLSLSSISGTLSSGLPNDSALILNGLYNVLQNLPTISEFSYATIADGSLLAIVENNIGVALQNVIIQIYDIDSNTYIATEHFPFSITSGSIDTIPVSLEGRSISNKLRLITWFETSNALIDSASTRYISTNIGFSTDFGVSSAHAEIPGLTRSLSQKVPIGETYLIEDASLTKGLLQLYIYNNSYLSGAFEIVIPDLVSNGIPLTISRSFSPQQILLIDQNIAGYHLIPSDSTVPQEIELQFEVSIPITSPIKHYIDRTDCFTVSASIDSLEFDYVDGIFSGTTVSFENSQERIDVPEGFDSLEFANVDITLNIVNTIDQPGFLNLRLQGSNGKSLDINGEINPDGTTVINKSDSSVSQFLSPIPHDISITGSVAFNDDQYHGNIELDDYITASININAPLQVILKETSIKTDILREELNQDDVKIVSEHIIEANFIYDITSALPIGARVNIYLSGDSASLFDSPEVELGPLYTIAADVDSNGLTTGVSVADQQIISIDSSDFNVLENEILFIGQQIIIESTQGQMVNLNQDGFIEIVGRIDVEYLFNGEF